MLWLHRRPRPGIIGTVDWFAGSPYQGAFKTRNGFGMLITRDDLSPDLHITHAGYGYERDALSRVEVEAVIQRYKLLEMRPVLPVSLSPLDMLPPDPDLDLIVVDEWSGQPMGIETLASDSALASGQYWKAVSYVTAPHSIQAVYHRSPAGAAAVLQRLYGHRGHIGEFLNAGLRIGEQNGQTVLYVFVRELSRHYGQWTVGQYGLLQTLAELLGVDRIQIVKAQVVRPYVLGINEDGFLTIDSCRVLTWKGKVVSQESEWLEHQPREIVRHMTNHGLDKPARDLLLSLREYRQATRSSDEPQGTIHARDYARFLLALYEQGGFDQSYAYLPTGDLEFPEPDTEHEIRAAVQATYRVAHPVRSVPVSAPSYALRIAAV